MKEIFDYDVAILGGGSAGYAAARTVAGTGLRAVVIEGGAEVGGLCILRGCMPTKALLYAAEVLHRAGHAAPWGIRAENVGFDFAQVMARKNALIKEFADDRRQQLAGGKFKFIRATARFLDPHTVVLSNAEPPVTAAHFVITTGSVVAPPPLPQLRDVGYLTSDEALQLTQLPKSLIVLGAARWRWNWRSFSRGSASPSRFSNAARTFCGSSTPMRRWKLKKSSGATASRCSPTRN